MRELVGVLLLGACFVIWGLLALSGLMMWACNVGLDWVRNVVGKCDDAE